MSGWAPPVIEDAAVVVVGVAFFVLSVGAIATREVSHVRRMDDGDEVYAGEALVSRLLGGVAMVLSLGFLTLSFAVLVGGKYGLLLSGVCGTWVGLVSVRDWDVPGLRGVVRTSGEDLSDEATLGARITGGALVLLGTAMVVAAVRWLYLTW